MEYHQHGHHHEGSFKELLPYTIVGVAGHFITSYLPPFGYWEVLARLLGGSSDTVTESFYLLKNRDNPDFRGVKKYVLGKIAGAALSSLPYFMSLLLGYDVNSQLTGSVISSSFAQFDQIGAGTLLIFDMIKTRDYRNLPIAFSSIGVAATSFILDYIARNFVTPITNYDKWLETYILSFLCLIPPFVGYLKEKYHRH